MTTIVELQDPESDRAWRWETGQGELLGGQVELGQGRDASSARVEVADPLLELANELPLPTRQSRIPIEVWFGAAQAPTKVFTGYVASYTPTIVPDRLEVLGTDRGKSARRRRKARNLSDNEAVAVVAQICDENDLEPDLSEASLEDVVFASVVQHGETDIELVERLLGSVGHTSFVRGDMLYVRELDTVRDGHEVIRLRYGDNVRPNAQFRIEEHTARTTPNLFDRDGTQAGGDDQVEATDRPVRLERTGLAIQHDEQPSFTSQQLERAMEAQARAQDVFEATIPATDPHPEADVDDQVVLEGFGPRFSGVWNVESVVHRYRPEHTVFELRNGGVE